MFTMLFSYQFCMDGPGRGFPIAAYCPSCGAWLGAIDLDHEKIPQVFDTLALITDVLIWAIVADFLLRAIAKLRKPEQADESVISR